MKKVSNNLVIMIVCGLALVFLSMLSADLVHSEAIYRFVDMPTDATMFFTDFDPRTFQSNLTANNITALSPTGNGISNFAATNYNNTIAPFGDDLYQGANTFTFQEPVFAVGLTFFATNYPTTDAPYSFDNNVPDVSHQVSAYDASDNLIENVFASSWSIRTGPRSFHIGGGPSFVSSYAGIWTDVPIYKVSFGGISPSNGALVSAYGSFAFSKTPNPITEPSDLYSETVMGDNPFAYYRLGELEVTNPVLDEMGTHHGSCQNNPTLGVSGALLSNPANTAMCFDSSKSQYIELTTLGDFGSRTTDGFTVEYWLRTNDPNNYQTILGTVNSQGFITDFLVDIAYVGEAERLRLYFRDDHWCRYNVDFYPDGTNLNIYDNQWHHIVHVYNPAESALEDQMTLYIDGKRQEVEVWLGDCVPYDSSDFNHPMTLGALNLRGIIQSHLNGCLDEVAFYARSLVAEEVTSHYQVATSVDTDGDGIPDDVDHCVDSDLSGTVVIDGCDSGVENLLFPDGCTISDEITKLANESTNHGNFTSAVAHFTNDLKKEGVITGREKGAIQSCVGQAGTP